MPTDTLPPGLDRLIAICQRNHLPMKLPPPLPSAPKQGDTLFGEPLDPQLADVYQRLGEAEFGPLSLCRPGSEWTDLVPWNGRLREEGAIHFNASLVFGWEMGFSLYYGTVPRLADVQELQPVVHIDGYEAQYAIPIASSVDRFFDAYSRYLERMVADPEYIHHGVSALHFPWDMSQLIARDEPLMAQVHAGSFDFLTNNQKAAVEWLQKLRASHP
jgi:hypothetical protein